ncbi:MAG: helix-turn-helix transcriptional regulator [bacterium]
MEKNKTYMDRLMGDKEFREKFDQEYQNLCIAEQIARARHHARLTQSDLAKLINTTKSAISRYESADYDKYGIALLSRIAKACGADLKIIFVTSKRKKNASRLAAAL